MISDFQLALIALAIAIIVAVVIYNRWQESKYKKRAEQAFGGAHPDVLIDPVPASSPHSPSSRSAVADRVEPSLGAALPTYAAADDGLDDLSPIADVQNTHQLDSSVSVTAAPTPSYQKPAAYEKSAAYEKPTANEKSALADTSDTSLPSTAKVIATVPTLHAEVDSIAMILADTPLEPSQYDAVIAHSAMFGKGVQWEGLNGGLWEPISLPSTVAYRELRVGLQLADRRGPVDGAALQQFNDMIAQYSASVGAVSQREEVEVALHRAQSIDAFCADTDIEIAVNIIGKSGVTFAVTKVRGLAESNGLVALNSGEYVMHDELGRVLYTLRNFDPAEPPGIKRSTGYLNGLTFAVDVPRTPDATRTFERMFLVISKIADVLQGEIVDDNRKLLTPAGRKVIADTITTITAQMEAEGVAAGSAVALRLYA